MTVALIVAAGRGERLRAGRPKALVRLAGRELFRWSLSALRETPGIERIVVAMPSGYDAAAHDLSRDAAHGRSRDAAHDRSHAAGSAPALDAVPGADTRSESVRRALAAAGEGDPVLVHDAARPLLTPRLAAAVIAALAADASADAAIAAAPVTDTIKRAGGDGVVTETLDRSALWSVQTPQVFRRAALERALDVPAAQLAAATDDAWLIERQGGRVLIVAAGETNIKVTTPLDLRLAELLLARRGAAAGPESSG
jgi:2-C-methyl-D-erythritol 4-phosphate cytidylyltransferase